MSEKVTQFLTVQAFDFCFFFSPLNKEHICTKVLYLHEPHQYIIETKSSSPGGTGGEKILILDTKFRLFTI